MADKVVKYNFLGAGLTYLLTGSFSKAISFLLVDFSCALKISTPVAYLTAIKEGLNREMVIKDGDVLEKYLEVDTFLFDKTGTITTSYPIVEKVLPLGTIVRKIFSESVPVLRNTFIILLLMPSSSKLR